MASTIDGSCRPTSTKSIEFSRNTSSSHRAYSAMRVLAVISSGARQPR
jgi:hypothetical protein